MSAQKTRNILSIFSTTILTSTHNFLSWLISAKIPCFKTSMCNLLTFSSFSYLFNMWIADFLTFSLDCLSNGISDSSLRYWGAVSFDHAKCLMWLGPCYSLLLRFKSSREIRLRFERDWFIPISPPYSCFGLKRLYLPFNDWTDSHRLRLTSLRLPEPNPIFNQFLLIFDKIVYYFCTEDSQILTQYMIKVKEDKDIIANQRSKLNNHWVYPENIL